VLAGVPLMASLKNKLPLKGVGTGQPDTALSSQRKFLYNKINFTGEIGFYGPLWTL
jgi:hypothetical protein